MAAAGTDGQRRFKAEGMGIGNDAPSRTRRKVGMPIFSTNSMISFSASAYQRPLPPMTIGILGRLEQIDDLPGIFPVNGLGIDGRAASS